MISFIARSRVTPGEARPSLLRYAERERPRTLRDGEPTLAPAVADPPQPVHLAHKKAATAEILR
jgi:hypothetical protein